MSTLKAVFFDLYNTLARFDPPPEEIQVAVCREFGLAVVEEGILRGYVDADWFMARENARHALSRRNRDERRRFFGEYERLVLQGAGVDVSPEVALDIFRQVQRRPTGMALFDDVQPALEMLLLKEKVLGLVSNINAGTSSSEDSSIEALVGRLGLSEYLTILTTSREAGMPKPHAPVFELALQKAQVGPHEAVHVGDQYHSDVLGAQGIGMHAVLLDRPDAFAGFTDCPRITTLMQLPGLVDALDG